MKKLGFLLAMLVAPSLHAQGTRLLPAPIGWSQLAGTSQQPNGEAGAGDTCPSNSFGGFGYAFDDNCPKVFTNWNSGIVDQKNSRMIIWGGGHYGSGGYAGNEMYSLDVGSPNRFRRLTGPSSPCGNAEACSDGRPNARHTYQGLVYMESVQKMWVGSGCLGQNCPVSQAEWTLDLDSVSPSCAPASQSVAGCTDAWTRVDTTATGPAFSTFATFGGSGVIVADFWGKGMSSSATDRVYYLFPASATFGSYDPATNANAAVGGGISGVDYHTTGAIEQDSGIFVIAGNGNFGGINLTTGSFTSKAGSAGCASAIGNIYPGITYNESNRTVYIWPGSGQTIYKVNTGKSTAGTWTCTAETLGSVTPAAGAPNGTYKRFGYIRAEDAIVLCPGPQTDSPPNQVTCYSYRTNTATSPQTRPLGDRCATTSGLLQCNSFENNTDLTQPASDPSYYGATQNGGNAGYPRLDSGHNSSGASALFFNIAAGTTNANVAGSWASHFVYNGAVASGSPGRLGPPGDPNADTNVIYAQFRVYFGTGWRTSDSGDGNKIFGLRGLDHTTCSSTGIVAQNQNFWGFPTFFTNCSPGIYDGRTSTLYVEQGDWQCPYPTFPSANCAFISENGWYTYYIRVQMVAWDGTTPNGSGTTFASGSNSIQVWVAPEGQPLKKFINATNYPINFQTNSSDVIEALVFFPYNTGLNASPPSAAKTVYYDDLIISTTPICPPDGAPPQAMTCIAAAAQGGSPAVSLNPATLTFGNQLLSTTSAAQTIALTNSGTAALTITNIGLTGANPGDYAIASNGCGASLGVGANCAVGITFKPVSGGSRTASLTFTTNAATSPDNVAITGIGTVRTIFGSGVLFGSGKVNP